MCHHWQLEDKEGQLVGLVLHNTALHLYISVAHGTQIVASTYMKYIQYMYQKGAVAPLYIGIVQVGQHRSHTFAKSAFPWLWALNPKSVFTKG